MQVFIRALSARPTAGPVNQVLWEAKQVWQNLLLIYNHTMDNSYFNKLFVSSSDLGDSQLELSRQLISAIVYSLELSRQLIFLLST